MIIVTQYTDLHRRAAESDAVNYFAANPTATSAYYICFADGRVERVSGDGYWVMSIDNTSTINNESLSDFEARLEAVEQQVATAKSSDSNHVHRQNEPSQAWKIQHDLNKFPSVMIVDSAKSVIIGEIQYIDANHLLVSFTAAFSGEAYLN